MNKIIIFLFSLFFLVGVNRAQWTQTTGTPQGGGITGMVVTSNGTIVVTCASFNFPNGQFGGIRYSTNEGGTWFSSTQHYIARTLALGQNGYVFASSWDYPTFTEGLYVSTNHGISWGGYSYLVGTGNNIFSIAVTNNNQTIYIGTRTGVMKSINGGNNFSATGSGILSGAWVLDLDIDAQSGHIAAGTTKGLYVSSNGGTSWNSVSGISQSDTVPTVKFLHTQFYNTGDKLLSAANNGNFYKSDAESEFLAAQVIYAFFGVPSSEIQVIENSAFGFIGLMLKESTTDNSISAGFAYSSDGGASWSQNNNGLPQNTIFSMMGFKVSESMVTYYAGTFGNVSNGAKIYKMNSVIGINKISSELPEKFNLTQNYPNPFNPSTKIRFSVLVKSDIKLNIFDILGKHIATLVNQNLNSGTYETDWNAENEAGGVYFYRIEAVGYSETKKMILVK